MSKQVDHASRKREILRKACHLFEEMGYQQVTFQQLADVCGLSRTALYKYFNTKKEILDNAINQLIVQQEKLTPQDTPFPGPFADDAAASAGGSAAGRRGELRCAGRSLVFSAPFCF